jgi:fucose permease
MKQWLTISNSFNNFTTMATTWFLQKLILKNFNKTTIALIEMICALLSRNEINTDTYPPMKGVMIISPFQMH